MVLIVRATYVLQLLIQNQVNRDQKDKQKKKINISSDRWLQFAVVK